MKSLLILLVFTCFSLISASAQTGANRPYSNSFSKGSWQAGTRVGRQGGNLIGTRNTLQLHAGYYLINKLAVGLSTTWAREGPKSFTGPYAFQDVTAGPYLRYQFTRTRLSPFIDASYQIGRRMAGEGFTSGNQAVSTGYISPGISVGVTPFLRAEINYHFQWITNGYRTGYIGQPQVGLTYLFAKN